MFNADIAWDDFFPISKLIFGLSPGFLCTITASYPECDINSENGTRKYALFKIWGPDSLFPILDSLCPRNGTGPKNVKLNSISLPKHTKREKNGFAMQCDLLRPLSRKI